VRGVIPGIEILWNPRDMLKQLWQDNMTKSTRLDQKIENKLILTTLLKLKLTVLCKNNQIVNLNLDILRAVP
jgi:hypothetical protein